jgi:hypothetical protein
MPAESLSWVNGPVAFMIAGLILFALAIGYAVIRGGLVPKDTHDRFIELLEQRNAESREREKAWQEAFETTEAARSELSGQVNQLVVIGRTTEALLRALPSGEKRPNP